MNKIHFESIDSTNNYLKQNYKNLENYTFVSADFQTNGKGRNKRIWKSENGENLLFSLLLLDKQLFDHYKELSIITAYSIIKELEKLGIDNLKIKWPNDIYVGDKKICGILLESISVNDIECMIIGVGLNVNQKNFDADYRIPPTSIYNESHVFQDLKIIKDNIYNNLINNIEAIKTNRDFYSDIKQYDYLINKSISYKFDSTVKEVKVIGIQKDYSLLVDDGSKLINLSSGEVEQVSIK